MKILFIIITCILSSILLVFLCVNASRENSLEDKTFGKGYTREDVYLIMGNPDNIDDEIIAVWSLSEIQSKSKKWRDVVNDSIDPYVAIFENDITVNSKRSVSQINMSLEASDQELLEVNKQ